MPCIYMLYAWTNIKYFDLKQFLALWTCTYSHITISNDNIDNLEFHTENNMHVSELIVMISAWHTKNNGTYYIRCGFLSINIILFLFPYNSLWNSKTKWNYLKIIYFVLIKNMWGHLEYNIYTVWLLEPVEGVWGCGV